MKIINNTNVEICAVNKITYDHGDVEIKYSINPKGTMNCKDNTFDITSSLGKCKIEPNFNECLPNKKYHCKRYTDSKIDAFENNNGEIVVVEVDHQDLNNRRLVDADRLIQKMKERDEDNGGEPLNAVDTGYHLAVTHLIEEIDNLLKEND